MKVTEVIRKPPTPEQQRINSLKTAKDRAGDALTAERQRQKLARAQKAMAVKRTAVAKAQSLP
jgi:hypothetical protein